MHKKILVARHAEAIWSSHGVKDFDRTLSTKGENDAQKSGKSLFQNLIHPDVLVSSMAVRALTTSELIAQEIGYPLKNIVQQKEIYSASLSQIFHLIANFNNDWNKVLLVGHNPTFSNLVEKLTEQSYGNLPPASIIGINLHVDEWAALSEGIGTVFYEDYP